MEFFVLPIDSVKALNYNFFDRAQVVGGDVLSATTLFLKYNASSGTILTDMVCFQHMVFNDEMMRKKMQFLFSFTKETKIFFGFNS